MLIGEASLKNLSGPLTIADYAGQSVQQGLAYYLGFLALVSVSLGVLNLLPLPMLDGGHLMYYLFEGVTGRPVSELWLDAAAARRHRRPAGDDVGGPLQRRGPPAGPALNSMLPCPSPVRAACVRPRRSWPGRARRCCSRRRRGPSSPSCSRTSASRACSAPTPARCSPRCRSASATPTPTTRAPPRCVRCSPPACSRTCASRSTARSWWSSSRSAPIIASVDFVGLKEFDKDALIKSLQDVGIGEGLPFDQALVDRAEQEIKRQYLTRSLYGAEVVTTVTPLERNRVNVTFTMTEGDAAAHQRNPHRRQQGLLANRTLLEPVRPDAERLADLVHQDRPLLARQAQCRPGDAARLLPEPRLPRVRRSSRPRSTISPDKQDISITINDHAKASPTP